MRTVAHRLTETPFRPSWIRAPGRMQNNFCNEAFVDELAAATGADPLEFRLRYINDARGIELLKRLAAPRPMAGPYCGEGGQRRGCHRLSEDEIRADLEGDAAFLNSLATLPDCWSLATALSSLAMHLGVAMDLQGGKFRHPSVKFGTGFG